MCIVVINYGSEEITLFIVVIFSNGATDNVADVEFNSLS